MWSGIAATLRPDKTQDKCQSLQDRGALAGGELVVQDAGVADGDDEAAKQALAILAAGVERHGAAELDHAPGLVDVTVFNGRTVNVSQNADGLPKSETLGSTGDTINNTYDPTDELSSISLTNGSSTLQSFSYAYSAGDTVSAETDSPSSSRSPVSYSYSQHGQVTAMTPGSGSPVDYGYDASGNLTTLPTAAAATYDDAGELTSATAGSTTTSYTYNADGQRLTSQQGSTTLTSAAWNGAGELTSYSSPSGTIGSATYNGDMLRTSTGGTSPQSFTWDASSQAPELLMDSGNAYVYGADGSVLEQVSLATGIPTYLVTDAIGSVRGIVSSSGALTATTSYDAWGNPQTAGGLTAYTPFGYAGAYADPTGLLYMISRYYDPQTGQFMSVDPDLSDTQEPYAYAGGNPVDNTDPNGLYPHPRNGHSSALISPHTAQVTNELCLTLGAGGLSGQFCRSGYSTQVTSHGSIHLKAKYFWQNKKVYLWKVDAWFTDCPTNHNPFGQRCGSGFDLPFFNFYVEKLNDPKKFYLRRHTKMDQANNVVRWGSGWVNISGNGQFKPSLWWPRDVDLRAQLWAANPNKDRLFMVVQTGFFLVS
jgi:RHS repeat-associated protein